jgi:hypothetical protein
MTTRCQASSIRTPRCDGVVLFATTGGAAVKDIATGPAAASLSSMLTAARGRSAGVPRVASAIRPQPVSIVLRKSSLTSKGDRSDHYRRPLLVRADQTPADCREGFISAGICLIHRCRPHAATSKPRDRLSRLFNYTGRPAGTLEGSFAPSSACEPNSMRGIACSRSFV